ncbi:MAG: YopX family protein [bacterium]
MRKYKAVIKETKEVGGVSMIDYKDKQIEVLILKYDCVSDYYFYDFDQVTLLESTGLVDSKGVEIYEGDIVSYQTQTNWGDAQVFYNEKKARYELMTRNKYRGTSTYLISGLGELEIIGNIHTEVENDKA